MEGRLEAGREGRRAASASEARDCSHEGASGRQAARRPAARVVYGSRRFKVRAASACGWMAAGAGARVSLVSVGGVGVGGGVMG